MTKASYRIPLKLTVFDRRDEKMVYNSTSRLRSKVVGVSAIVLRTYDHSTHYFECEVMYSRTKDSWNAFKFESTAELKRILDIDTEPQLLKELLKDGMLDKDCVPKGI